MSEIESKPDDIYTRDWKDGDIIYSRIYHTGASHDPVFARIRKRVTRGLSVREITSNHTPWKVEGMYSWSDYMPDVSAKDGRTFYVGFDGYAADSRHGHYERFQLWTGTPVRGDGDMG